MNKRQITAVVAPPALVAVMYPAFQMLADAFGRRAGWYLGLIVYWLLWGTVFPLAILGRARIGVLIRPRWPTWKVLLLISVPLLMASLHGLVPGMRYEKESLWVVLALAATALGNGCFEEVLWRGVYMELFPRRMFYRVVWPSVRFGLWHYAPGSLSPNGNVAALMVGAGLFGLYLSYLALKTRTVWWSMVTHALAGLVMIA